MSGSGNTFFAFLTKVVVVAFVILELPTAASYSFDDENHQTGLSLFQSSQSVVRLKADPLDSFNDDFFGVPQSARHGTVLPRLFVLALAAGMFFAIQGGIDDVEKGDVKPGHNKEGPWFEVAMEVAEKDIAEPERNATDMPCALDTTAITALTCPFDSPCEDDDGWEAAADHEYERAMELQYEQLSNMLQASDTN